MGSGPPFPLQKTFSWGGLLNSFRGSFPLIMEGSMAACRQRWCWSRECYILQTKRSRLTVNAEGSLSRRDLKARPQSDTLPPPGSCLLIVPFPLGASFFPTTTVCIIKRPGQVGLPNIALIRFIRCKPVNPSSQGY